MHLGNMMQIFVLGQGTLQFVCVCLDGNVPG